LADVVAGAAYDAIKTSNANRFLRYYTKIGCSTWFSQIIKWIMRWKSA